MKQTQQSFVAHIGVNKSRIKEYHANDNSDYRNVYLNDNTEFQIELFNPYHYDLGISVTFDNKSENRQLLVLRPGERVWLERYLDEASKFKFSVYEVENSEDCKNAISENGNLIIRCYKEKENYRNLNLTNVYTHTWDSNHHINTLYYHNNVSNNLYPEQKISSGKYSFVSPAQMDNWNSNSITTDSLTPFWDGAAIETSASTLSCERKSLASNSMIETGRVEKGSYSKQNFDYVNKEFENFPTHTEYIKILPVSRKPVTSKDLVKKYCYNCGRKLTAKFKYCPFCGTKQ